MDFQKLASKDVVQKTSKALEKRGVKTLFAETKEEALKNLNALIPAGAELMTGGSITLEQIGFIDLLKSGKHKWINLKDVILAEKDEKKQAELRQKSVTAQYFIGSVHAITEDGVILVASASGSQIPSYAFSSDNVIWVVGAQKIVPTTDDGFTRIRECCFPLEDKRMKSVGYPGSAIGKILMIEKEIMPRKLTMIFVNEKLGF